MSSSDEVSTTASEATTEDVPSVPNTDGLRHRNAADLPGAVKVLPDPPKPNPSKKVLPKIPTSVEDAQNLFSGLIESAAALSPGGNLTVFLVTWLPLLLTGFGSVLGFLFSSRGYHFLLGAVGLAGTIQIQKMKLSEKESFDYSLVLSTFLPALMVDTTGWLVPIFMLIAASGAPFLLNSISSGRTGNDAILSYNVATVVTFIISSGGVGLANALLLASLYTGASLAVPFIPKEFRATIDNNPHVKLYAGHPGLLDVLLQTLVAKVLLYLLYILILPAFLFETQNGIFFDLIYTAIGLGTLVGALFLTKNKDHPFKLHFLGAVFASYLFVLAGFVFQELTLVVVA